MRILPRFVPVFATAGLLAVGLGACSNEEVETHGVDTAVADAKPAHRYVISAIDVPDQSPEFDAFGFNLDGDDRRSKDNKAGALIVISESYLGHALQPHIDAELAADRMNTIIELHSDGFGDQLDVAIELRPAVREDVGLRAAAMTTPLQRIYGRIESGRFITQHSGQITLHLAMFAGQAALAVELIGARLEGQVGPTGLSNVILGGGITVTQAKRDFVPALFQLVAARIARGNGDETSVELLQLFDTNKDGSVGDVEFADSNTTNTLLSPDLDLAEDATMPIFMARPDGHRDSISIGVKLQAVALGF